MCTWFCLFQGCLKTDLVNPQTMVVKAGAWQHTLLCVRGNSVQLYLPGCAWLLCFAKEWLHFHMSSTSPRSYLNVGQSIHAFSYFVEPSIKHCLFLYMDWPILEKELFHSGVETDEILNRVWGQPETPNERKNIITCRYNCTKWLTWKVKTDGLNSSQGPSGAETQGAWS